MGFGFESCTDSRRLLVLAVAFAVYLAQDADSSTLSKLASFFTVLGDILALFSLQPDLFQNIVLPNQEKQTDSSLPCANP